MWGRVFDPVGRLSGRLFRNNCQRRFAPPDRVVDPVPHGYEIMMGRSCSAEMFN